jgi:hypothetical protein
MRRTLPEDDALGGKALCDLARAAEEEPHADRVAAAQDGPARAVLPMASSWRTMGP